MVPVPHFALPLSPRSPDIRLSSNALPPQAPHRARVTGVRRRAEQTAGEGLGAIVRSARRLRLDRPQRSMAPVTRAAPTSFRAGTVRVAPLPVVRWERDRFDDEPVELAHGQVIQLVDEARVLLHRARFARAEGGLVTALAGDAADGVFSRGFDTDVAAIFHNHRGVGLAHLSSDARALPRAILRAHAEFFASTGAPAHVILGHFPDSYRPALMADAAPQSPEQLRVYFAGAFDASRIPPGIDEATYRACVVDLVIERDTRGILHAASRAQRLGGPEFEIDCVRMAGTMVAVATDGSIHGLGYRAD